MRLSTSKADSSDRVPNLKSRIISAILVAAALWFFMFSPWTGGILPFWVAMSCSALILTTLSLTLSQKRPQNLFFCGEIAENQPNGHKNAQFVAKSHAISRFLSQIALGIVIAFALWGVFWVGDKLSSLMFDFARPQVDDVYSMKNGFPVWVIAMLLLFVIGPAEEFFWRGFVQRNLYGLFSSGDKGAISGIRNNAVPESVVGRLHDGAAWKAFIVTSVIYALVHIWSFNFMLVMAALVAGAVWGFIYLIRPQWLPALIVSHAVWDALVFVILPI